MPEGSDAITNVSTETPRSECDIYLLAKPRQRATISVVIAPANRARDVKMQDR